jgi:hypothetical protein
VQLVARQCSDNAPFGGSSAAAGNRSEEHVVVTIRPATAAGAAAV